jgi:hypothetical protein
MVLLPRGSANDLSTFFERRLKYCLQLGITQKLISQIEGFVELPFGSGYRIGKIPFLQSVDFPIGAAARLIHSMYLFSPLMAFYLIGTGGL